MSRPHPVLPVVCLLAAGLGSGASAQLAGNGGPGLEGEALPRPPPLEAGTFPAEWIWGNCHAAEPPIQVHAYNDDVYILRQSPCLNFEAPFQYLIFGREKVLLLDTGAAGDPPIAATVGAIIDAWLTRRGQASIDLVVAHTHGHFDHFWNDLQFVVQPGVVVVGPGLATVKAFWGITDWPTQIVSYDLGDRVLDVVPVPGHEGAHIAIYDRRTGLLLTGDTLYPGFLFIQNWNLYRESIARLVAFTADRPVSWVLGAHIEMTSTPGVAYPYGTVSQPDEHVLQLRREHLLELHAALQALGGTPTQEVHDDFIITP